jgi:hypothetical protein
VPFVQETLLDAGRDFARFHGVPRKNCSLGSDAFS